ncbi:MAG: AraC family transcriptional regulator [Pseudobutyrivibrio sp.]|nr:AraC family transcriptional regulator [Pseudobutyrivibrio sp.]
MRKEIHNKNYLQYLISYLVILVLPMIITVGGYLYSNHMIKEQVLQYQTSVLKRTQGIGDQIIKNHIQLKGALFTNKQVKNLMNEKTWQGELMFDVLNVRDNLQGIANSNNLFYDVQVYFPMSGNMINTQRRYPTGYLDIYTDSVDMVGDYTDIINFSRGSGYYILHPGQEDCKIYFYQNFFANNYKDVLASVVTVLSWDEIEKMMGGLGGKTSGTVFLIDERGNILGERSKKIDLSSFTYTQSADEGELINVKIDKKKYICSYVDSQELRIKYFICLPRNEFYHQTNILLIVIFLQMALCIVLGSALAVYFARWTYNPLEKLLLMMNVVGKSADEKNGRIVDSLESGLNNILDNYRTLELQLESRSKELRSRMLSSVLNDKITPDGLLAEYKKDLDENMELNWQGRGYRVLAFSFDSWENSIFYDRDKTPADKANHNKGFALCFDSIENVVREIFLGNSWGKITISDGSVVCITEDVCDMRNKVESCLDFFTNQFLLEVHAAVSAPGRRVDQLPKAYSQVMEIHNYMSFFDEHVKDIIFYDEFAENEGGKQACPNGENIKKFSNYLSAKDYKSAKEFLGQMIDESFTYNIHDMEVNKLQASSIITLMLGMVGDIKGEQVKERTDRLVDLKSISQLRTEADRIFDEIIEECESKEDTIPRKIVEARKYIDENYCNPNLSLSEVAEKFNMSESYTGKMFKKYTGSGMLSYLHIKRVEHCKKLLDQGESVKDSATKSGFLDSKAMIRTFRKYEGITPGQYKKRA